MKMMPAGTTNVIVRRANVKIIFAQKTTAGIFKPATDPDLVSEIDRAGNKIVKIDAHTVAALSGQSE